LAIRAIGLVLNIELAGALYNIITRPFDVYSWVVGRRVLLDGVAFLRLNGNLALFLDFSNSAARLAATPVPGDCSPMRSANATLDCLGSASSARSMRANAPTARPNHAGSFHEAHPRAGAGQDRRKPNSRTFIALLDLGVSHVARLFKKNCASKKMT
jgi:hypothetical protein